MLYQGRLGLIILLLAIFGCTNALVIEKAEREIDITAQRALHSTRLFIKNNEVTNEEAITLCMPASLQEHAASIEVGENANREKKEPKKISIATNWAVITDGPANISCAEYTLSSPLKKGETRQIILDTVYTKVLIPRPAEIKQGEFPLVVYNDVATVISPYKVLSDETKVKLGTENVESYTAPSPASIQKSILQLGPYTNSKPFSVTPFSVHFENDFPFLEATSVVREISVSHWGTIFFEERYDLVNNGAKIVGEWSRLDTLLTDGANVGSAPQLQALLPHSSHSIYFRDDIGNISTSRVRPLSKGVQVALVPRFPLFGGWRTKFVLGYAIPMSDVVVKDTKNGRYAVITVAKPSVRDTVFENLEVRVVLPEGASNPKVESHIADYELEYDTTYTYFDIIPRKVVVLKMKNIVPEHTAGVAVSYVYSPWMILIKPMVLVGGFMLIIVAYILISSVGSGVGDDGNLKTKMA